jgi:hypothetical protein
LRNRRKRRIKGKEKGPEEAPEEAEKEPFALILNQMQEMGEGKGKGEFDLTP